MKLGGGGYENLPTGANITNNENEPGKCYYLIVGPNDLTTVYPVS